MNFHRKRSKEMLCILTATLLLVTGCHNPKEKPKAVPETTNYKVQYYDQIKDIDIKELDSIKKIPPEVRDRFSVTSSYNKIYLYEYIRKDKKDTIHAVYSCDIDNDITKKVKNFEDKFVVSFTEFNHSFVYAYLDDERLKVVQEKNGTVKTLAEATVYNRFSFTPQFFIADNQLFFLLTDTKVGENKVHVYQKFISLKDDKLKTIYKTDFSIENDVIEAGANHIDANEFQIQGDGKMMFQVRNDKNSILFKYDKGKLSQQTIHNPNYYLIGYLDNSVIFFDESKENHLLYNLDTGKSRAIDYTGPMYYAKIYNNTVMTFNDKRNKLWALHIKKNGDYALTNMDKLIFDKLKVTRTEDRMNFIFSDGSNILLTESNPESKPYYSFYSIKLPH